MCGVHMQEMTRHLEQLSRDAAECERISKLATDVEKRQLFERLAEHLRTLAGEVERSIAQQSAKSACKTT